MLAALRSPASHRLSAEGLSELFHSKQLPAASLTASGPDKETLSRFVLFGFISQQELKPVELRENLTADLVLTDCVTSGASEKKRNKVPLLTILGIFKKIPRIAAQPKIYDEHSALFFTITQRERQRE